jgi:hypothetical protein
MVDGFVAGERSHVAGSRLLRGDELGRRDSRRLRVEEVKVGASKRSGVDVLVRVVAKL